MAALAVQGTIQVPGDKSISHRALIFGALANGRTQLRNLLQSADVRSTANVLRTLGVSIEEGNAERENGDGGPGNTEAIRAQSDQFSTPASTVTTVHGRGLRGLRAPNAQLDCGNSGTTARLMSGVMAAHPFASTFVGDASLSKRPMRRVSDPLSRMGASFEFANGEGLPMTIRGGELHPLTWDSPSASAQVKSAILLAGLVGQVPVRVNEPSRSRDHTERFLSALGVTVNVDGTSVDTTPVSSIPSFDMDIPGDPSSAAFFAALAVLAQTGELRLTNVCLNPTRTGFFAALERMGGVIRFEDQGTTAGEPVGTIVPSAGVLRGITVESPEIPSLVDELPMLACVATRAEGETLITGAAELRVKESDRIRAVVSNLVALGATAEERPDGMRIIGSDTPLRGRVTTYGDHRIAMAFGVLAALPGNAIEIDDRSCASVSYPTFWDDLAQITAVGRA